MRRRYKTGNGGEEQYGGREGYKNRGYKTGDKQTKATKQTKSNQTSKLTRGGVKRGSGGAIRGK